MASNPPRTSAEIYADKSAMLEVRPLHCRKFAQFSRDWYLACDRAYIAAVMAANESQRDGVLGERDAAGPGPQSAGASRLAAPRHEWTARDNRLLRRFYAMGATPTDIAEYLGFSYGSVSARTRHLGLKLPRQAKAKEPPKRKPRPESRVGA